MDIRRLFGKTLPTLIATLFLGHALFFFSLKYALKVETLPPFFDNIQSVNRFFFFFNFYVPFILCCLGLFGCLYVKFLLFRVFCLITALTQAVIASYVLNDVFTISLEMFSACVIITGIAFERPKNIGGVALALLLFGVALLHPTFLGPALNGTHFFIPSVGEFLALLLYLTAVGAGTISASFLSEKYRDAEATIKHLNLVCTQILLFNHRLQEYARNFGEESVKKDRLRFTSDLHDNCGYVFTNIIAISDAAISWPVIEEEKTLNTFHIIRTQARDGLQRTREILGFIRSLHVSPDGVETLFTMKKILEDVTGIAVSIETGNMRFDYGNALNMAITRTVQEAFTNAMRHGKASHIFIQFWEFPDYLSMTVSDNGLGAQNIVKGIGLAGMEERIAALNGTLEIASPEDGGFRITARIPLEAASERG
jgi:signal transduction histidine kinase